MTFRQHDPLASSTAMRPRLVVAGLSGGAGKTIVSLGLCRALVQAGRRVFPFKKGPDYIDAAWLGLAARRQASNLDTFLLDGDTILSLFLGATAQDSADALPGIGIIEGNRGLFDGGDVEGSHSTSVLARLLAAPVLLVVDCTKMTRTVAALIRGCQSFEPGVNLAGVVLNRTAGPRHRAMLRQAVETYTDVPVMGILPKLRPNPIPERHMGLISNRECSGQEEALDTLGRIVAENVDLDAVQALAEAAPSLAVPSRPLWPSPVLSGASRPRVGVVRDAALWFYYPENIEALAAQGLEIVEVSLLSDAPWPELHGLYLGGGFPETQAERLSANTVVRDRVRSLSEAGMPIYAECGGFMYLCDRLVTAEGVYPMAGVFPVSTDLGFCPQGLGYVEAEVVADNPFFPVGATFRGHEFHYSRCTGLDGAAGLPPILRLTRGSGMGKGRDGLLIRNTFAAYTHIHALSVPCWSERFAAAARVFRDGQTLRRAQAPLRQQG